jgi:alanine racemase
VILPMTMADLPPPTLRLHVDGDALAANWRALDAMSGTARAGAAVKANAYGLGVDKVLPVLRDAGCDQFFVAHWSEVPAVLRHVPPAQVAVLHGARDAAEADFARASGVTPVVNSLHQAQLWQASGGGKCHLMVDTGINRLGVPVELLGENAVAALDVDVLLSHLASADEDSGLNAVQLDRFRSARERFDPRFASLANSAGIALGRDYHFDLTRPGLSLYGGIARPELSHVIRQVAFPQAMVIQRRTVAAGASIGYNATFTARENIETATVSIGYADGFLRARGPGHAFEYRGASLPILGRVSMDMIVIDCSKCPELREGDWVDVPFDLPAEAKRSGFSQYELLTTIGQRFFRT